MIYTALTKKAMQIAFDAHKDAIDKGGLPYILHPVHVAESMTDEITTAVALLHDVVEDTDITCEQLLKRGIDEYIAECVDILTQRENENYFDYIERVKTNPDTVRVKLADLEHNSDLSRIESITKSDLERTEKYKKAIEMLKEEKQ